VNADGSSAWELTGRFEFDTSSVHVVVDVAVHGVLGADGHSFIGPVDLQVKPEVLSDCTRHWSFSATNITSAVFLYNDQTGETQIWFMSQEQLVRRATVLGEDGQPALIGPPFRIVGVAR
jgi:hypothetical protein